MPSMSMSYCLAKMGDDGKVLNLCTVAIGSSYEM